MAVPLLYDYERHVSTLSPVINALLPISSSVITWLISFAISLSVCAAAGWIIAKISDKLKVGQQQVLNAAIILVAFVSVFEVVSVSLELVKFLPQMAAIPSPVAIQKSASAPSKPDVYYIILEDYANNQTLKSLYQYDNQPFLDNLTAQGFYVRNEAFSNYPYTQDAIPSTLQMDYLGNVAAPYKNGPVSSDFPLRSIFNNPPIAQALKAQGYSYYHLGSWWESTRNIPSADINYSEPFKLYAFGLQKTLSEFESGLLGKSVFGRLLFAGMKWGDKPLLLMKNADVPAEVNYQFDTLKGLSQSKIQGGRFIFAHIILPHAPFVFSPDGSTPIYSSDINDNGATIETKYVNQLRYLNSQVQTAVDSIKKNSKQPPVIIIQSDEGPHPREMSASEDDEQSFDLTKLSDTKLMQKYGILAAYELPGASDSELAQISSPVNVFRVLLNHYFGYQLGILPDCSYAFTDPKRQYGFVNVTARLHRDADSRCDQILQK